MNFETATLESLCELIVDCPHSTPKWTESGIIVLRNQNIRDGELDLSSPSYTNEEGYKSRIKRAIPRAGDIVFTREAPMGEVCIIPPGIKCCLGQRQVLLRPKKSIHGEYLYWALQSPFVQHQISWNEGTGTTVSNLRIPVLKALQIPRRGHEEPLIADILSSLTKKIRGNHQINQTLEQMAQAIFKSWFVDFEPVKAKIAALEAGGSEEDALRAAMQAISGKGEEELTRLQAEQPEQYAELRATAELFPSALQESELGEIPEGWEASDFGSVSSCFDRHRIPLSKRQREQRQGSIPYYGATSIMDYVDEPIFDGVYLLLGEDGSVLKEDGSPFTQYIWGKSWVNNHAHVLQGANGVSTEQLYLFIGMQNITAYVTGAVQLKLNQKNMNSIPFIKAPDELNTRFAKLIAPMFGLRRTLTEENGSLTGTRDALLPRLLSGELSISDAEDQLAEEAEPVNV